MAWMQDQLLDADKNARVTQLATIAQALGCTTAQLAIAWCLKNPHVSTVITGASRISQFAENIKALEIAAKLDQPIMSSISDIVGVSNA